MKEEHKESHLKKAAEHASKAADLADKASDEAQEAVDQVRQVEKAPKTPSDRGSSNPDNAIDPPENYKRSPIDAPENQPSPIDPPDNAGLPGDPSVTRPDY